MRRLFFGICPAMYKLMNIQSFVITFAIIFLSMFQANASEIRQCRDIFMVKRVNYKFVSVDHDIHSFGQTPRSLNIRPTHSWLDGIRIQEIEKYNHELFNSNRPRTPLKGGQRGKDATENWLHYYLEKMPLILSDILQKNYQQLSPELRQFLIQLMQVTQMGVDIRMLPESSGKFSLDDQNHRIAVTTGRVGDPIYVNENYFSSIKSNQVMRNQGQAEKHPYTIVVRNRTEADRDIIMFNEQVQNLQAFRILVHELGHYLNIKDDQNRILDQYASEISKLFDSSKQEFSVNMENQEHIKLSLLNFKNGLSDQQILISDIINVIDLNPRIEDHLMNEIKVPIQKIHFKDIFWEKPHDWDAHIWSNTTALMLTAEVTLESGGVQNVRMRIVIEPTISEKDSATYSNQLNNMKDVPLRFYLKSQYARIGIQTRHEKSDLSFPKASIEKLMSHQTELKSGEKWTTSFIVNLEKANDATSAHIELSSDQLHWSGFFKKQKIKAQKAWIEPISSNQVWVHMEHTFPLNQVEMKYFIDQVVIRHKDSTLSKLRPQVKQSVLQKGATASAKLIAYGNRQKYVQPMNQAKVRHEFNGIYKPGVYVPLTFLVQQNSTIQRAELSFTVVYENDKTVSTVEGFVVDLLKYSMTDFIAGVDSVQLKDFNSHFNVSNNIPLTLYTFSFALPEKINGKKVERIEIENVYILFNNMDQIFEPVVNTLFIQH